MRVTRPAIVTFVLLALAATPVAAAPPAQADVARAEHQRVLNYWTPGRMASAQPRDFVWNGTRYEPAAKPPGAGKPGGGNSSVVTGASWTKGGLVEDAVGKVYFTMGGSAWTCSGSVASDGRSSYSLVLTAAHCAYDETNGTFATNWMFIPAYGNSPTGYNSSCATGYSGTTYGCWTATALVVHAGYADAGGFTDEATWHDFAFAVVGNGGKSNGLLESAVGGSFGISFTTLSSGWNAYAFGYPAAQKYKGTVLTYCAGPTSTDPWNDNKTWSLGCDMTGGSSGGPWFASFSESSGSGTLRSLNSYGYSGVKNMYGPKFNGNAQAVYSAANSNGTTSNTIVGR